MTAVLHYILDESHNPVPESDLAKWAEWNIGADSMGNRQVDFTIVGGIIVSTIFFGFQVQLGPELPPFFETRLATHGQGYSREIKWGTWEEARQGHQFICQWLANKLGADVSNVPLMIEMIKEFKND